MDARTTLRHQMQTLHGIMEAAIGDCPEKTVFRKLPDSTVNSIGAIYAHTIFGEDGLLNGLIRGDKPVYYAGGWADKIGLDMPHGGLEPDWAPSLDMGLFREYAKAVYEATDNFLANASDADFAKVVDAGFAPPMPVQSFVANILAWHVATHQGEISALKGVQGLNGLVLTH
ncbi:MAG TPA: DinB family protein [Dehalococcoidia bacterium]|nr:DinB family protein [Dehalococcoidia bacterium]